MKRINLKSIARQPSITLSARTPSWQRWFAWILEGCVIGWLISHFNHDAWVGFARIEPVQWGIAIASLPILYYLAIAVHEGGHILGGQLVGFRFQFLLIGPLMIYRQTTGLKLRLSHAFLWGGMTGTFPTDPDQFVRRMSIMVASGPLASLLLTLLMVGVFFNSIHTVSQSDTSNQYASTAFVAGGIALLSFIISVVSIMPSQSEGLSSDGDRLLKLFTHDPQVKYESALMAVNAESLTGKRPRDWNTDWIQLLLSAPHGSAYYGIGHWYAFYQMLDHKDIAQADQHLRMALGTLPHLAQIQQPALMFEAAFFNALYKKDLETAKMWLHRAKQDSLHPSIQLRAEAAVLLAEQNTTGVHRKVQQAMAQIKQSTDLGMAIAECEWLRELENKV